MSKVDEKDVQDKGEASEKPKKKTVKKGKMVRISTNFLTFILKIFQLQIYIPYGPKSNKSCLMFPA